jgi:DNA-binding CsgD family transcriptional regulator
MVSDDRLQNRIDDVIGHRLPMIRRAGGVPIVFGGAIRRTTDGTEQVVIGKLLGTVTDAMNGLTVAEGRGLGGIVMTRVTPCIVRDYASSTAISHHYDDSVVHQERLTSIVAVPVRHQGRVAAVLYAAVRADDTIGDRAVQNTVDATRQVEREIVRLEQAPVDPATQRQAALDELAALVQTTHDPHMKARLGRIHRHLSPPPRTRCSTPLTPRELEVLQIVATGLSNVAIADHLGLSPESVKTYVRNVMRKLQVHNRTAAVHTARASGLL